MTISDQMLMSSNYDLIACNGVGTPISTCFALNADDCLESQSEQFIDSLEDYLSFEGCDVKVITVLGRCQGSQVDVFDNSPITRFHEARHRILNGVSPYIEASFNESWAYAATDFMADRRDEARARRRASLLLCPAYDLFSKIVTEGGSLSDSDFDDIDYLVNLCTGRDAEGWTDFVNVVGNFRYYAAFYDLLNIEGSFDSAELAVLNSARDFGRYETILNPLRCVLSEAQFDYELYSSVSKDVDFLEDVLDRGVSGHYGAFSDSMFTLPGIYDCYAVKLVSDGVPSATLEVFSADKQQVIDCVKLFAEHFPDHEPSKKEEGELKDYFVATGRGFPCR